MDAIEICNKIRMETLHVDETDFPLEVFPESVKQIVLDFAMYENYLVEYTAASMLSAVASAIGNSIHIRIKGNWVTNSVLYMMLVGRPGLGKTPPLNAIFKPIRQADKQEYRKYEKEMQEYHQRQAESKAKSNAATDEDRPVLVKTIVSDFTPEALMKAHHNNPRGVVILVDEIIGLFNSTNRYNSGQLIEQLLTSFSGSSLDIMRMNNPMPISIEHPCINMIGTTQTKLMPKIFQKGYEENGFLDRFLFVLPKSPKIAPWVMTDKDEINKSVQTATKWEKIINKVLSIEFKTEDGARDITPLIMEFDLEACKYFYDWWNRNIDAINAIEKDEDVESRIMKSTLIVGRLSLVIQVMRWACGESHIQNVDISSVKSAIQIYEYFEKSYRRIQAYVSNNDLTEEEKDLLDRLTPAFDTSDILKAGATMNIPERTIKSKLKRFCKIGVINKISHGHYEKIY